MSYTADELHGICGMMPAFSTPDASDLTATQTVDVENLQDGVAGRPTELADYVAMGPQQPPRSWIEAFPEEAAKNTERAREALADWLALCNKYRPEVEGRRAARNDVKPVLLKR